MKFQEEFCIENQYFWTQKPILDTLFSQILGIKALELTVFGFHHKNNRTQVISSCIKPLAVKSKLFKDF
ncbi:MAG: hypothetical protein CO119_07265 [Flavobacteriales bacterium CG_4_9_14_3_um_filter_40_17]|nr:MAG: hypothetical protein CO119_07265 [Flavobacteriales bacterium CG_4_9_14_3_um_filter_40_17]